MFWLHEFSVQIKNIEERVLLELYPIEHKLTPRDGIVALDTLINILWIVECEMINLETGRKRDDNIIKEIQRIQKLAMKIKEIFLTME